MTLFSCQKQSNLDILKSENHVKEKTKIQYKLGENFR